MTSTDSTAPAESVDLDGLRALRDDLDVNLAKLRELTAFYTRQRNDLSRTIWRAERDEQSASAS